MKLHDTGVYLVNGVPQTSAPAGVTEADAKKGTIAYGILKAIIPVTPCRTCA